jgi:hypothetical protein
MDFIRGKKKIKEGKLKKVALVYRSAPKNKALIKF